MNFEDLVLNVLATLAAIATVVVVGILVAHIVYFPAGLRADKACLELGYPKSRVTYDFEAYCQNLEGVVTYKVEKVQK